MKTFLMNLFAIVTLTLSFFLCGCLSTPPEEVMDGKNDVGNDNSDGFDESISGEFGKIRITFGPSQNSAFARTTTPENDYYRVDTLEVQASSQTYGDKTLLIYKDEQSSFDEEVVFHSGDWLMSAVAYEGCVNVQDTSTCSRVFFTPKKEKATVVAGDTATVVLNMFPVYEGDLEIAMMMFIDGSKYASPQDAIDIAIPYQQGVYFPAGRYNLTNSLVMKSGVPIIGAGYGKTIFSGALKELIVFPETSDFNDNFYWNTSLSFMTVQNTLTNGIGILIEGKKTRVALYQLLILAKFHGIEYVATKDNRLMVVNCSFVGTGTSSLGLQTSVLPTSPIIAMNVFYGLKYGIIVNGTPPTYGDVYQNDFYMVTENQLPGKDPYNLDPQFSPEYIIQSSTLKTDNIGAQYFEYDPYTM